MSNEELSLEGRLRVALALTSPDSTFHIKIDHPQAVELLRILRRQSDFIAELDRVQRTIEEAMVTRELLAKWNESMALRIRHAFLMDIVKACTFFWIIGVISKYF